MLIFHGWDDEVCLSYLAAQISLQSKAKPSVCKILCELTILALYLIAPSTIIEYVCMGCKVHTGEGLMSDASMFTSAFLFHSTNQSIKLQVLVEFHYPPFQLPQELQHHAMVSHRPLRSGKSRRRRASALIIATLHVLSATLLVTGSWQGPIRACTRKRREANEILVAVLLLLSQHRPAEPVRSATPPFSWTVCVRASVSIFVPL